VTVLAGAICGCHRQDAGAQSGDASGQVEHEPADGAAHPSTPGRSPALLPHPRIINVHEHLMKSSLLADYGWACEAVGIESTVFVGSPGYTLYGGHRGFDGHHENNRFLCELARLDPTRVYAWVTLDPLTDDLVPRLEEYLTRGASGVKLYLGHTANLGNGDPFHCMPLQ